MTFQIDEVLAVPLCHFTESLLLYLFYHAAHETYKVHPWDNIENALGSGWGLSLCPKPKQ